jgi:hypothetical protein
MAIRAKFAATVLAGLMVAGAVWAEAKWDLSVRREIDREGTTTFLLANRSDRLIKATLELRKQCSGQSNRDKVVRTYWVEGGKSVKMGRARRNSSCRHEYTVAEAEYR